MSQGAGAPRLRGDGTKANAYRGRRPGASGATIIAEAAA